MHTNSIIKLDNDIKIYSVYFKTSDNSKSFDSIQHIATIPVGFRPLKAYEVPCVTLIARPQTERVSSSATLVIDTQGIVTLWNNTIKSNFVAFNATVR